MGLLLYKTEIVCRVMLLSVDKGTEIQIEKKIFIGVCRRLLDSSTRIPLHKVY